ncbi:calcium-binding and coiled-coil domain-containing protein 1b isoform X1 [Denticeps clupeoides]|uniref:Calcium-binding and coiled-coil domain-containing protein 1 n=1 Tax=Denticeps clupeoides TaxID=299321 RepID=A0AAY4D9Q4_9TELE|nr:calcium-binding and coiled-coil domain-containing protein 1-like isoform X1 [Denticeps clupeoides]XP_028853375.1 calcium-binding and coiled-coil domain-containing protein 1-like isoform X1 [Denticeps clupeoides]
MHMDNIQKVIFRNVGRSYFPQTRVECHYNVTGDHSWANRDWIGLFKVGWSTVREYYTYVWALVPEGYSAGQEVDCCATFQPSYLPRPGAKAYQFVYVNASGEVCGVSSQFVFSAPRPLDEVVTLENEKGGEEGAGEDLLVVVPKAQILQSHLEECQNELKDLKMLMEANEREKEQERARNEGDMKVFVKERDEMKEEIIQLMDGLRHNREELEKMELKHKETQSSHQSMSAELVDLLTERDEVQQQIRELADDNSLLTQHWKQAEAEVERMKERVKKMALQRKEEEKERKNLQEELEAAQNELRVMQERMEASELTADALRRDLSELGNLQGHSHAELHQTRLQLAQVNLQLSQANLALREGQAAWSQEKEQLRQIAEGDKERVQKLCREIQRKDEWLQEERAEREKLETELGKENDCNRAQLSECRKEVQELKASLRGAQREREQTQLEKQILLERIRELEKRQEMEADGRWYEAASSYMAQTDSISFEDKTPGAPSSLQADVNEVWAQTQHHVPVEPDEKVEIGKSYENSDQENHEPEKQKIQSTATPNEDKALILGDPILSDLADTPLW